MPFKSEKQLEWMYANAPLMAARWEEEHKKMLARGKDSTKKADQKEKKRGIKKEV